VQEAKPETPPPPAETPLQQQVRTATEKLDANDLDGAAAAIDEALKLSPDSAEAQALRTRLDAARAALVTAPAAGPVATSGPPPIPDWPSDWPKPARRDREPASVYIKRGQEIQRTYSTGSSSLDRGEVALAISSFEAVLGLEPGFHDAPQKLQRARQLQQAAQAREDAGRAFEAGRRAEDKREIGAAITQYQRAAAADANRKDAAESVERLRTYVNQTVPTLLRDAKIAEAYRDSKKAEALYEQAQRLLPDSDPRRREVELELKRLRGGSL
jgi:tetratricopeptide (TPR) repeat protein